eukprot:8700065-Alexandrium_andersonii.AAC.1
MSRRPCSRRVLAGPRPRGAASRESRRGAVSPRGGPLIYATVFNYAYISVVCNSTAFANWS